MEEANMAAAMIHLPVGLFKGKVAIVKVNLHAPIAHAWFLLYI
jgi:hypothetical protein